MSAEPGAAISRFDFTSGLLRGSHFTLYSTCLTHRGEQLLETFPLAGIAALRVAYERTFANQCLKDSAASVLYAF